MAYKLKTTGIAASCTMCIAVDPDTNAIKDFASPAVTADMVVDAGITVGAQDWDGNSRKYFQLAAGNYVAFGAAKPVFALPTNGVTGTIVFIGQAAGPTIRVFGPGSSYYFASRSIAAGGASLPLLADISSVSGAMTALAAGDKTIFGFSLEKGAESTAYAALHNAASMTSASIGIYTQAPNWSLPYIGRRGDNTTQQDDKIHAVLIFSSKLSQADWDALRDDWFGVLLDAGSSGVTGDSSATLTLSGTATGTVAGASITGDSSATLAMTGSATGSIPPLATFTSEPLKSNNGTLQASLALDWVRLYNVTTGALVVTKTGLSTNSAGVFTVTDAALTVGQTYKADWQLTTTGETRMPSKAAT